MGWHGMAWNSVQRDGVGWEGTGQDGVGWDGMKRNDIGRNGRQVEESDAQMVLRSASQKVSQSFGMST